MSKDQAKYAKLSEQQKWEWHAEVYAFRHVVLARPINEPTPCDEASEWYNEGLVKAAASRKLAERKASKSEYKYDAAGHTAMLEGRAAINAWARRKGRADIDAYAAARGMSWVDAYAIGLGEIVAETIAARGLKDPRQRRQPLDDIRRDLGLSARDEPTRQPASWTAEEMAAGRSALGLESKAP